MTASEDQKRVIDGKKRDKERHMPNKEAAESPIDTAKTEQAMDKS